MSTKVASLYAEITADTTGLEKGLKTTKSELDQANTGLNNTKKTVNGLGGVLGNLVNPTTLAMSSIAALTAFVKSSIKEASEAAKVDAKLGAVIKSTGGIAGLTTKAIDQMSAAKSKMTGIDDDVIKNSSAVMLTFTQVGKEVFPDAMQAAIDMSSVMGGDLQGSVTMLGKALNVTAGDVAAANMGMTALRRNGVSFTEEQKQMAAQMIQVGDVAGYQKMILAELNKEFGGAAEAMLNAGDKSELVKNSWQNLREEFGKQFLPAQQKVNAEIAKTADSITESMQASNRYAEAIDFVTKTTGESIQVDRYRNTIANEHNEAIQRQAYEYMRLQQYGAAWEKQLAQTNKTQQEQEQDYAALLKGGSLLTEMQAGYKQSEEALNKTLTSGSYMRDQYKAQQQALRDELNKGIITQKQYDASVVSLYKSWSDGSFQAKEQQKAQKELSDQKSQQTKDLLASMLAESGASEKQQLDYAVATGKVTKGAADQYNALTKISDAYKTGKLSADQAARAAEAVANNVAQLNGMSAETYVDIYIRTHGSAGGWNPGANIMTQNNGADSTWNNNLRGAAGGGRLDGKGWTLVGDRTGGVLTPYTEAISPEGEVLDAKTTKWAYDRGLLSTATSRAAGSLGASAAGNLKAGRTFPKRVSSSLATAAMPADSLTTDTGASNIAADTAQQENQNIKTQQASADQLNSSNEMISLMQEQLNVTKKQASKNDLAAILSHSGKTNV